MTKHRWDVGSTNLCFSHHIDPEKEEALKWMKIGNNISPRAEYQKPHDSLSMYSWRMWDHARLKPKRMQFKAPIPAAQAQFYPDHHLGYLWHTEWQLICNIEAKVKKILKIAKNINRNNKDGTSKKNSELVHLIEDFHQQYDSLFSLYEDLRGMVKQNVNTGDEGYSSPPSDSESYYSPVESHVKNSETLESTTPKAPQNEPETSDLDDTILKDKLTSSSEVIKESSTFGPQTPEFNKIIKDISVQDQGTRQRLANMEEMEALFNEKRLLNEQLEMKSNEAKEMKEKISSLEKKLENTCKEKALAEENEKLNLSKISELVDKSKNLQIEVDDLNLKKHELDEKLLSETKERSSEVKGLTDQVESLKSELLSVNNQKAEVESELKKKSAEIETLRKELKNQALIEKGKMQETESQVKDFQLEVHSLSTTKSDLEEQITKISDETHKSMAEKEELQGKISKLENSLKDSENELSAQEQNFKVCRDELENERENLKKELEALQNDHKKCHEELEKQREEYSKTNVELTNKIADQQNTLLELEESTSRLRSETEKPQTTPKTNFNQMERKMEEMAEEFRKQFEDKYRILSRRIRVAEQLHVEHKEWYLKTKEDYEQGNKDLEIGLMNIKDITQIANGTLISLDSVALKFEECTANFLNRISKSSCELKFAKDWAIRKNKALLLVKEDTDCLLAQLDDKEAEILVYREKVWKSENKVRELEKMMNEKEEWVLGMQEEKREAIRQLCVWIDYHRGRSDYYKKMLSEMNPAGRRKA